MRVEKQNNTFGNENGHDPIAKELKQKELYFERRTKRDSLVSNFDELLRQNYRKDTIGFSQSILKYIAEISEAFNGVFYLHRPENNTLAPLSGYACNVNRLSSTEILMGEGLPGQAAESMEYIFFNNIPIDAIHVQTAGNISFNVGSLLVMPLASNAKLFGVVELLFLKPLEQDMLDLLLVLAKNTAATLESILNNATTQKLLAEAVEKEQKLMAQEEELRQNLEETQAIQEELQRKQSESEGFINAVNESGIALVEFDLDGTILKANGAFLKLLGYEHGEIIGKKHRIFVDGDYASSSEYEIFWSSLRKGVSQIGEFKRVSKSGKEVYIHGTYSVIRDVGGTPERVLKLANDQTELRRIMWETEKNNELLRTQEEELRQNLEELSATQELASSKQEEMENFIDAINNSSFAMAEFDMNSNILGANDAFLEIFGYEPEEIQGGTHKIFVGEEFSRTEEYRQFWDGLRKGIPQKGRFKRIGKNGWDIFIQGAYSIIKNRDGDPVKVVKLAVEIAPFE